MNSPACLSPAGPFLEALSCSIMAKECTAMEAELPSCPSGSCCQALLVGEGGKICSQSTANASVGWAQHPPAAANLLKWFKHPLLTSNVCCHGGIPCSVPLGSKLASGRVRLELWGFTLHQPQEDLGFEGSELILCR